MTFPPGAEVVSLRIPPELKPEAERVLGALGLTLSDGICLFLRKLVNEGAMPFEIRIANAETRAALRDTRTRAARFDGLEDMLDGLGEEGRAAK